MVCVGSRKFTASKTEVKSIVGNAGNTLAKHAIEQNTTVIWMFVSVILFPTQK